MRGHLRISTSGWNYKDWRGAVYPPKLAASKWLAYYATLFDTVEVNNTFYRFPKPNFAAAWSAQVPEHFEFALKLWRGITHYRKMLNCTRWLTDFGAVLAQLHDSQRGPLLVQLPPHQQRDDAKLDTFLAELRQCTLQPQARIAIEFRHESWLATDVYRILDRHDVALCLHDMPARGPVNQPNDTPLIYIRRHGPKGDYHDSYGKRKLNADAKRIAHWLDENRHVYIYFNNDYDGHAVHDAQYLRNALRA